MSLSGTLSADGDTDVVVVMGQNDGDFGVIASGTWGGGTLTTYLWDATAAAWKAIPGTAKTTDTSFTLDLPAGPTLIVKATLAGATTPTLFWRFMGNVIEYTGATLS